MHIRLIGIVIVLLTLITGLATLPDYGLTWDEPGNFAAGRVYVEYLLTHDARYLRPDMHYDLTRSFPFVLDPRLAIYPPVANTLASFSSLLFAEKLHILSINTAHHVIGIVFGAILVGSVYALTFLVSRSLHLSVFTGLATFLYPSFFAQIHNNTKDIPLIALFTLTITLFVAGMKKQNVLLTLLSGVALGFSLATKFNAIFILPILFIWLTLAFHNRIKIDKQKKLFYVEKIRVDIFLFPLVGFATMIAVWPWLWADPARRLLEVVQYFLSAGWGLPVYYLGHMVSAGVNTPWHYPWVAIAIQTPPLLLATAIIGLAFSISQTRKNPYLLLFPIWFFLPLLRFFSPNIIIYSGLRHVLETIPAVIILSGIGLKAILTVSPPPRWPEWTPRMVDGMKQVPESIAFGIGILILAHMAVIDIRTYPFQSSYFNIFAGGARGAEKIMDVEFWGESAKQALDYFEALPGNKKLVYMCDTYHLARVYPTKTLTFVRDPKQAEYVYLLNNYSWFGPTFVKDALPYGEILKTIAVDETPIGYLLKHKPNTPFPPCTKSDVQPPV